MFNRIRLSRRLKNQRGVTLIEILAVVIILGVLSAIAVPSVYGYMEKAKETQFILYTTNIKAATERAYDLNPALKNIGSGSGRNKRVADAIAELMNAEVYEPSGQWYMLKGYEIPTATKTRISVSDSGQVYLVGDHVLKTTGEQIARSMGYGMLATPAEIESDPTLKNPNIFWSSNHLATGHTNPLYKGKATGSLSILLLDFSE